MMHLVHFYYWLHMLLKYFYKEKKQWQTVLDYACILILIPRPLQNVVYFCFWTRNSSMGPPWMIDPTTHRTMSEHSYHLPNKCCGCPVSGSSSSSFLFVGFDTVWGFSFQTRSWSCNTLSNSRLELVAYSHSVVHILMFYTIAHLFLHAEASLNIQSFILLWFVCC